MPETVVGISGLTRKYLPAPQAADIGKYLKIDASGNPVYYAETPGGVVDEAGANAANSIGDAAGATTKEKLVSVLGETTPGRALVEAADVAAQRTALGLGTAALAGDASESAKGVVQLATQAEANAGANTLKAITPKTFAGALEAGQIITTTLAVDGGFAATNFGSTEAISGGTANG